MLTVSTNSLVSRLSWFKRHKAKHTAIISTTGGILRIQAGPLDVAMPCIGSLPHPLAFDVSVFRALVSIPISTDTVEISYSDGTVMVGGIQAHAERAEVAEVKPLPVSKRQSTQLSLEF